MKKLLVTVFIIFCFMTTVSAVEKSADTLSKLEDSMLGATYQNEKTENRLSRLEEYVYGTKKNGNTSDRLKRLSKDLNADVIGEETTACENSQTPVFEYPEDSSVDYPIIDDVERSLKIKSQPAQSLHSRLVAIEKQIFNKVYDTDDFYTRVERIKGEVYKNSVAQKYEDDDEILLPEYNSDSILNRYRTDRYGNLENPRISKLERKILGNQYNDENENDRLARLENAMFDTEFYYDDTTERLERLEGAVKGQKSASKYDNNKLQQRINTALQIGAMILMVLACIL